MTDERSEDLRARAWPGRKPVPEHPFYCDCGTRAWVKAKSRAEAKRQLIDEESAVDRWTLDRKEKMVCPLCSPSQITCTTGGSLTSEK